MYTCNCARKAFETILFVKIQFWFNMKFVILCIFQVSNIRYMSSNLKVTLKKKNEKSILLWNLRAALVDVNGLAKQRAQSLVQHWYRHVII